MPLLNIFDRLCPEIRCWKFASIITIALDAIADSTILGIGMLLYTLNHRQTWFKLRHQWLNSVTMLVVIMCIQWLYKLPSVDAEALLLSNSFPAFSLRSQLPRSLWLTPRPPSWGWRCIELPVRWHVSAVMEPAPVVVRVIR